MHGITLDKGGHLAKGDARRQRTGNNTVTKNGEQQGKGEAQ